MKTVNLENEIKDNYKAHRLTDEHDLSTFQFNYYDMIDFAKFISDKTVELCAENGDDYFNVYSDSPKEAILNTKNKIV